MDLKKVIGSSLFYYSSFGILLVVISQLIGFNGLYGQDSYEYCRYTNCWHLFFTNHQKPPDFIWPIYYPLIGSALTFLFSTHFSLQLISIVSFCLSALLLEKTIITMYKAEITESRIFISLIFLLSPYLFRSSLLVMSDMLCVLFIVSGFYWLIKSQESLTTKSVLFFTASITAAVLTRYAAIVIVSPMLMYACVKSVRQLSIYHLAFTGLIAALLLVPYLYVHRELIENAGKHPWVQEWNFNNLFKRSFETSDGNYQYSLPNILYSFSPVVHPGFLFLGIVFLTLFKPRQIIFAKYNWLLISIIIIYGLFLAGIPFQNNRFLLLTFPFILLLFYPSFIQLLIYLRTKKLTAIFVTLCIASQLALDVRAFLPFYKYNQTEKNIALAVNALPANTLYTFSLEGAINYYGTPHKIISLYPSKLDTIRDNACLLFNEPSFSKQFEGKNPMINFELIKSTKRLVKLQDFENGWTIYEID